MDSVADKDRYLQKNVCITENERKTLQNIFFFFLVDFRQQLNI